MTPTGNGEPDPLEPARQTTHQVHPLVKQCDDDGLIIASQEEDDMVLASMGMNPLSARHNPARRSTGRNPGTAIKQCLDIPVGLAFALGFFRVQPDVRQIFTCAGREEIACHVRLYGAPWPGF